MQYNEPGICPESLHYFVAPTGLNDKLFYHLSSLGSFRVEPPYCVRRMDYNSYLFITIREGTLCIEMDDGVRRIGGGNTVLIDCHRPHGYYAEQECAFDFFHFDGAESPAFYRMLSERSRNVPVLSTNSVIDTFFESVLGRFEREGRGEPFELSVEIYRVLGSLMFEGGSAAPKRAENEPIARTVEYIHNNLNRMLAVDELAKVAGYSLCYFNRRFQAETGLTPYRYTLVSRISRSKQLLKTTVLTVRQIATEVGFSSPESFINAFERETGLTPDRFRKVPL